MMASPMSKVLELAGDVILEVRAAAVTSATLTSATTGSTSAGATEADSSGVSSAQTGPKTGTSKAKIIATAKSLKKV